MYLTKFPNKGDIYESKDFDLLIDTKVKKHICLGYSKEIIDINISMMYKFDTTTRLNLIRNPKYLETLIEKNIINMLYMSCMILTDSETTNAFCNQSFYKNEVKKLGTVKEDLNTLILKNSLISDNLENPKQYMNLMTKEEANNYIVSLIDKQRLENMIASDTAESKKKYLEIMQRDWVKMTINTSYKGYFFTRTLRYLYLYKATRDTKNKTNMWYYFGKADRNDEKACFHLYIKGLMNFYRKVDYKQINRKDINGREYLDL